ncbi:hypothetical protein EAL2_c06510 [Peptoclostridium acidaminophilum DSM 3953]|uniref:Uncharacterized protein n=1 Tax=Peptoclostridium acidaminophilum DSM 3953 TaxID=1286171 RepID=W8TIB7_PEPAC|nr:hypothetical protein EAL2_c06510 [Peptoclostridium acidaminophilum DSM 3953]
MANMKRGSIVKIIISVELLVPVLSFVRKNTGNPTASAAEKQMSCRLVRLNTTFVFTVLKSLGTDT